MAFALLKTGQNPTFYHAHTNSFDHKRGHFYRYARFATHAVFNHSAPAIAVGVGARADICLDDDTVGVDARGHP